MNAAAGLLDGSRRPGVYRILDRPEAAAAALRAAGWRVAVLPPSRSTTEFYAAVQRALALPAWFGRNLDALADSLTELAEPTALVLAGWTELATAAPQRWSRVLEVLEERCAGEPPFAVLLA